MIPFVFFCRGWSSWFRWTSLPPCSSWDPFICTIQSFQSSAHRWSCDTFCPTLPFSASRNSLTIRFLYWKVVRFHCCSIICGPTFLSFVCFRFTMPVWLFLSDAFLIWRASCIAGALPEYFHSFAESFQAV